MRSSQNILTRQKFLNLKLNMKAGNYWELKKIQLQAKKYLRSQL